MSPQSQDSGHRQAGFTIIELLIVVTILALLAGILAPVLESDMDKAKDARRKADLKNLAWSLEAYRMGNGSYPTTGGAWQGDPPAYGGLGYGAAGYIPGLVPDYLQSLPRDPDSRYPVADQGYVYKSDGQDYKLMAHKTPIEYPAWNRFRDPARPNEAWQVSSPGGYNW